jgi:hypothetical protein
LPSFYGETLYYQRITPDSGSEPNCEWRLMPSNY